MLWRNTRGMTLNAPAIFIHPCQPIVAKHVPAGPSSSADWLTRSTSITSANHFKLCNPRKLSNWRAAVSSRFFGTFHVGNINLLLQAFELVAVRTQQVFVVFNPVV
jgi:hypothetical protein